jgi:uncharacterized protein YgbK (DUF1537 family)
MAILVIADDLTGAAEIGGMVLRFRLSVEIVHTLAVPTSKDVQILNTNTRSLKADEARSHLVELFATKSPSRWDWIYLKFDSALRGHIKDEISFYRRMFQKDSVVFCPVNPALGRVIRDGVYWVEGLPIAETDFARDPEFPIVKSGVLTAIGADSWQLATDVPIELTKDVPYIVAAAQDGEDLNRWASSPTSFGIYAGAAAFFEALLCHRVEVFDVDDNPAPVPQAPALYVCGSKYKNSLQRIGAVDADKVVYWQHIGQEREAARNICHKIDAGENVILALAPIHAVDASAVRLSMAQVVALVQQDCAVRELLIEGGATARSVLEALAIDTLVPVWEYGQGVIRNRVPHTDLNITLKPGSYPWTEKLWTF